MTARARNGRFTAERTTTMTQSVTERIEFEPGTLESLPPLDTDGELRFAQGWDPGPITPRHDYLAQRVTQRDQCLGLLLTWDASSLPGAEVPEWLIRQAVTILRAGPGATPLELTMGRSI